MILGIDVGGTHTDAVLIEDFQVKRKTKVLTNEANLLDSLLAVTTELFRDEDPQKLERVVLSTTISTNAVVQSKIDRVGMLIVSGPGLSPTDLPIQRDVHFLSGAVNHRGVETAAIDPEEVGRTAGGLQREGIRHVGIVGKFSTRNPQQEFQIRDLINDHLRHVSLGHRMSGHLNFPRRIATTYLNAAIWERYQKFVKQILYFVKEQGITVPLYILKADGGTFDIHRSVDFPVQTILSGPAASIMGILSMVDCAEDAIALDIGGTTTDIAIFADGVPLLEPFGVHIEGHKTLIRGLRTRSIGVGGDSRVQFSDGGLTIGPEREGPAAAFGGPFPTPTDAMIVLGLTDIGDAGKATAAIQPIAAAMNVSLDAAARAIFNQTCEKIVHRVRAFIEEINNEPVYTIHELLEGKVLKPTAMYIVGGPAEPMSTRLGEMMGCPASLPRNAEVANAVGAALARTTAEMTILADTERRILTIAEEGLQLTVSPRFTLAEAIAIAKERLRERALDMGAKERDLEIEVIECQEFNMVREYYTAGKNIRVKVQVKPGLISTLR